MARRSDGSRSVKDTPAPAYQEGNVESIGDLRPAGRDDDDRTGHGRPPDVAGEPRPNSDAFVSDEVDTRDRQRRGPTRTRS